MATILSGVNLNSTTDATTHATASFTPAAADLLVVAVHVSAAGTAPALTTSIAGETFTLVETTQLTTNTSEIRLYVANQLTTAVARTITHTQTGIATSCYIQVLRVAGMTRTGLAAIRQKAETLNAAVNARLTMTLPVAALTSNPLCASVLNSGLAPTTPTGWTAIGSLSRATPTMRSAQWAINSGFTGTLVQNETTQNSPTLSSGVAFELDASVPPITFTSLTTGAISPSTFGPFATAVITPAANTLTLACINFNYSASSGPTAYNLSVTGCGLTWVQVARQNYFGSDADPNSNSALFRAVGASPTTGSLSINSGAPVGMDGASWAIVSVPGASVANSGANAIIQAVFSTTDGSTALSSKAVTLAAFAHVNNATFAMVATTLSSSGLTTTPTAGMTELGDVSSAWSAMETHYHIGNRTALTATMSSPALISLLGLEIRAAVPIVEATGASTSSSVVAGSSAVRFGATGSAAGSSVVAGSAGVALPYTALWSWNESAFATAPSRQALIDFAVSRKITTIYQNSQAGIISNQTNLTALLDLAAANSIGIEFLFGDANWTYTANHQQAVDLVNSSNAYIAGLTNKPTGYHFDVEPHTLGAAWGTDPVGLGGQLIDLYVKLVAARSPSVKINGDIALGYKDVNITRNTVTKTLSQWLVDVSDAITIMSYRDFALGLDSITFHADHPVTYASTVGKKVYAGVETQFLGEPEKVTFFEEGPDVLNTELAAVRNYYLNTSGFGGIAIHDYVNYNLPPYTGFASNGAAVSTGTGEISIEKPLASAGSVEATGTGELTQSAIVAVNLASDGTTEATGTGNLSIDKPLSGIGLVESFGTGAIALSISIASDGTTTATGSGEVSINKPLASDGVVESTGAVNVNIEKSLSADGINEVTGTGNLNAEKSLASDGSVESTGTANLNVTANNSLASDGAVESTGTGSINLEKPLFADGAAEATGTANVNIEKTLASDGTSEVTGTGNLSLEKPLSSDGTATVTGTGDVSIEKQLASDGAVEATGTGNVSIEKQLGASGSVEATVIANETVEKPLGANGLVEATGTENIQVAKILAADGLVEATASGDFVQVGAANTALAGDGTVIATGTGEISLDKPLSGAGDGVATGTEQIAVAKPLAADGSVVSAGTGEIQIDKPLAGAGDVTATGTAGMGVGKPLEGVGNAEVTGTGEIALDKPLTSAGFVESTGTGEFSQTGAAVINLGSDGNVQSTGTGDIAKAVIISADGFSTVTGAAELYQAALHELGAAGFVESTGTGSAILAVPLSSVGNVESTGTANLNASAAVNMGAAGVVETTGTGSIMVAVNLSGTGEVIATGNGEFAKSVELASAGQGTVTGEGVIQVTRQFYSSTPSPRTVKFKDSAGKVVISALANYEKYGTTNNSDSYGAKSNKLTVLPKNNRIIISPNQNQMRIQ